MSAPQPRRVRVVEVVRETADAHSLVLEPSDGGAPLDYRPGQFLTVGVPSDRPGGAARCYSLCSSPVRGDKPTITVKRTADGYASNWICDHVAEGDELPVLPPSGRFTPAGLDADLLLVAGGSGITPVMSILTSVLHAGTGRILLLYANRDERSVIFGGALDALAREHGDRLTAVHLLESVQGRPSRALLAELARPCAGRHAYVCGPGPFMEVATAALADAGLPRGQVHVERFTSLSGNPFADPAAGAENGPDRAEPSGSGPAPAGGAAGAAAADPPAVVAVELDGAAHTLDWPRGKRLLDVLLDAGLDAPFSCREGACSACACILSDGDVDLERNEILDDADLADGIILACQAIPLSDRLAVTYDA
ncbi:2Fe-2S iron-sulfur cluster-binding protein [Nocardiopsis coralliicola]